MERVKEIFARLREVTNTRELWAVRERIAELLPEFREPAKDETVPREALLSRTPSLGTEKPKVVRNAKGS